MATTNTPTATAAAVPTVDRAAVAAAVDNATAAAILSIFAAATTPTGDKAKDTAAAMQSATIAAAACGVAVADIAPTAAAMQSAAANKPATIAAAADLTAAAVSTATATATSAKTVRESLQKVGLVRTGGNAANGLLAVRGASLAINTATAAACGVTIAALIAAVGAVPAVKNPWQKTADHLVNCVRYADPARLAACNVWQGLRAAGLVSGGQTVPAFTIDDKPAAAANLTRTALQALPPTAVIKSPMLAAIAALSAGHAVPAWVRDNMPAAADKPATVSTAAAADKPATVTRKRPRKPAAADKPATVNA